MPMLLDASIGETIITVIFGLLGFVAVILVLIYFKAFLSKVANIRYIDRQGKTKIDTDTFDNINEMIGEKVSSLTTSIKKSYPQTTSADGHSNIIKPKQGVGDFNLDDPISKAINELGSKYNLVEHATYSIEYQFPVHGISFFVKYNDIKKKVFSIKILQPCKAKTSKGVSISSKLRDVLIGYGTPEFTTTQFGDVWSANYKGISFHFMREIKLPKYPFDEPAHLDSDIIGISITK